MKKLSIPQEYRADVQKNLKSNGQDGTLVATSMYPWNPNWRLSWDQSINWCEPKGSKGAAALASADLRILCEAPTRRQLTC